MGEDKETIILQKNKIQISYIMLCEGFFVLILHA